MGSSFSRVQIRELVDKNALYGVTNGTAAANKALVLDGSKNIATINQITATTFVGTLSGAKVTAPVAAGASLAVTAAMSGGTIKLDTAAGSVATLPAATGSGAVYRFVVTTTTTSGAHKILAASSSDFINGLALGNTNSTGAIKGFASAAATNHSIQMPFAGTQPSGGFIGDYFELTDVATNLWNCNGMYGAGTTPTTPFSSATS